MPCRHIRKLPRRHIARPLDACSFACPVLHGGMPRRYQRSRVQCFAHGLSLKGGLVGRARRSGSVTFWGCDFLQLSEFPGVLGFLECLAAPAGGGRASQCFLHRDRPRLDRLAEPSDRDRPLMPARFRRARFLSELLHFSRTRRQRVSVVAFAKGSEGYPALVRRPCRRARLGGSSIEA